MTDLETLYAEVTAEIFRTENLPPGPELIASFYRVSILEEKISRITEPTHVEGMIARVGAVTASLSAGYNYRALMLITRYLQHNVPNDIRARLTALLSEAQTAIGKRSGEQSEI